jgi:hypothetical protein
LSDPALRVRFAIAFALFATLSAIEDLRDGPQTASQANARLLDDREPSTQARQSPRNTAKPRDRRGVDHAEVDLDPAVAVAVR